MICLDRPFVFIPVQKTGSTSIRRTLEPYGCQYLPCPYHVSVRWCLQHARPAWDAALFTFGVARNPWDLWVSWYYSHGPFVHTYSTFRAFILDYETWRAGFPFPGQVHKLVDDSGHIAVDMVARFEDLQRDWLIICDRLKIRPAIVAEIAAEDVKAFGYTFDG